jgi:hypothetical protein
MSTGDDESSNLNISRKSYGGYGSTGITTSAAASTAQKDAEGSDFMNADERMVHCENNDRYITRIREHSGLNNAPAMVNFQIARSRRR